MRLINLIFFVFLSSLLPSGYAQTGNAGLEIKGEHLQSKKLKVFGFADFISFMPEYYYNGKFETNSIQIQLGVKEVTYVRIVCGDIEKEMMAEPGKHYSITILNDSTLAPLFSAATPDDDINIQIQKLNANFNDFLLKNSRKILDGQAGNDLKAFILTLRKDFPTKENSYFSIYLQSKIGELEMLARTKGAGTLIKNYLWNRPIPFYHHEFMYLFNELLSDKLKELSGTKHGNNLNAVIRKYQKFSKLDSLLFQAEPGLVDTEFRHAVLLSSLSSLYRDRNFDKSAILFQIQQAQKDGATAEIRKIAERLYQALNKPAEGKAAGDLLLTKDTGEPTSLFEGLDKPVYLVLFQVNSDAAIREISAMPELIKNFNKSFNFISVAVDASASEVSKLVKLYKFKFPIYTLQNTESLMHYPMESYLDAYLIGTDRKFLKVNLPGPAKGADVVLHSFVRN